MKIVELKEEGTKATEEKEEAAEGQGMAEILNFWGENILSKPVDN